MKRTARFQRAILNGRHMCAHRVRQPLQLAHERTLEALGDAAQRLVQRLDERLHPLVQRAPIEASEQKLDELLAQMRQCRECGPCTVARLTQWVAETNDRDEPTLVAHAQRAHQINVEMADATVARTDERLGDCPYYARLCLPAPVAVRPEVAIVQCEQLPERHARRRRQLTIAAEGVDEHHLLVAWLREVAARSAAAQLQQLHCAPQHLLVQFPQGK